ncbi:MAG: alpha/beta fold hydrolase [Frankiaceae bacterium]
MEPSRRPPALLPTPSGGCLEHLVRGTGAPTTVYAHGLGGSIGQTRPLAAGVAGRRAFFHFRNHGGSRAADERYDYAALARELDAVADHVGATRALGVSMGAGAILRSLVDRPGRFERVVLFLPGVVDRPRTDAALDRFGVMASCVERGDVDGLMTLLIDEVPPEARESMEARRYVRHRALALVGAPVAPMLRGLPGHLPVDDRAALRGVDVPALVVGQHGDELHPVAVAEDLAQALPRARLHVLDDPWPLFHARRELRALLAGFLDG